MTQQTDWQHAPLSQLVDHIVASHHAYLHRELPLLGAQLSAHMRRHWMKHPELMQAHTQFNHTQTALEQHLMQEETAGFPLIRAHEKDPSRSLAPFTGTLGQHAEAHAGALAGFEQVKKTLWNGKAPADVGPEVAATLQQLDALLADLTEHIHLENDILFPRVKAAA